MNIGLPSIVGSDTELQIDDNVGRCPLGETGRRLPTCKPEQFDEAIICGGAVPLCDQTHCVA